MTIKEKDEMINRILSNYNNKQKEKEEMINRILTNHNDYINRRNNIFEEGISNSDSSQIQFNNVAEENREKFKSALGQKAGTLTKAMSFVKAPLEGKTQEEKTKELLANRAGTLTKAMSFVKAPLEGKTQEEKTIELLANKKPVSKNDNIFKSVILPALAGPFASKHPDELGYVAKRLGSGVLGGLGGIVQADSTELQNNLQKGKKKGFVRSALDFANSSISNATPALLPLNVARKFGIELLTNKEASLQDKAKNAVSINAFEELPFNRFKKAIQVAGSINKDLDSNVKETTDKITAPQRNLEESLNKESEKYNEATKLAGNVAHSVGYMVPSIAASMVAGPEAGLAVTGFSAKGTATEEALKKGAELDQAVKIGDIKGLTEVGTEMLTGGINFFGKGVLDDIVEKGITKKVSNKVGQFLLKQGYDFAGEIGEEVISDLVGTLVDKGTVDPNATYTVDDLGETAVTTLLTTFVLKALGVPMSQIQKSVINNQQKNIQSQENDVSKSPQIQKENTNNISNQIEDKNAQNVISQQIQENTENIDNSMQENNENKKILYHQTSASSLADFDLKNRKAGLSDTSTPKGIFLKDTDVDIGLEGKNQLKFETLMNNTLEVKNREELKKIISQNNERYANIIDNENKSDDYYSNKNELLEKEIDKLYEKYYYEENPDKKSSYKRQMDELQLQQDDLINEWRNGGLNIAETAQDEITKTLKEMGYDSVIIEEDEGSFGRKIKSYVVLDTSQLKELTPNQIEQNTSENLHNSKIEKDTPKIDFTRKINKETAIDKYNEYKQNILKGRAEEVNSLIKNKNETINSLEQKIAEKKKLLEQKANKDTVEANRIKMYIGTLQQRINRIENEYNSRIDRKNEKVTKDNIKLQLRKETKTTRKDIQEGLLEKTGLKSENFDDAKNITMLNLNRTSPERVNEKVFGHELGTKVNEAIIYPTKHNEAEKTRFKNKEREDIKSWGIKDHSKESAVLQKYAEKSYVNENDELVPYTENDLKKDIKDESIRIKIRNAAKELRAKYDMYIDKANEILVKLGYDPIPKRDDYVRHFNELNDIFTRFGIPGKIQNENALPTDINGITDTFMPGKSYFANTQKRQGIKTTYDAITGIDGYIEGISNLIYHTEDIQRLRAFEKHIRETYGETGWDKMEGLTEEEKVKRIQNIENNHLSNYAAWLTEYTNNLAGKKSGIDRSVEKLLGRNIYSTLNTIKKQVGSNMTGFNVSSALSNFVSVIQGGSKTKKLSMVRGSISTFKNIFAKDNFIDKSDFLTNRFGSDRISKTMWEKASNAGQVFMNATDYFTANLIVRSKYYENLSKGMSESEAIKKADDFGARIMGDRSLGATPVLFNSKTLGVVTQFQFEVFNQYDSMIHDTIQDYKVTKDNKGALRASMGAVWSLGQLMAFSYFFNNAYEAVLGNRPAFDVVDIIRTAFGLDDDDDSEDTLKDNVQQASKKFIEGLPIINLFSENARIPTASGIPNPIKLATGESTIKDEAKKLIYLLPPTGGNQAKKTYQGAKALIEGGSYTTSKNGEKKLQFKVDNKDPKEVFKALMFGKWSTSDAKLYDSKALTEKEQKEMEELNISFKDYKQYKSDLAKINQIKSDKNDDGKSISGSASGKKAYAIMSNKDYSRKEKEFLIKKLNSEDSEKQVTLSQLEKLDKSEDTYKYFYKLTAEKQKEFLSDLEEYNFSSKKLVEYYKSADAIENKYSKKSKEIKALGLDSEEEKDKISEINASKKTELAENILNTNYTNRQKLYLYSKEYSSNNVKMAQALDIDADAFLKVESEQFKSDKYANGKTVKNSKLNKVYSYVEGLPNLSVAEKAILIKSQVSSFDKYNNQIVKYVDSYDLTTKEKEDILKNMGFKIKNGRVYD